MAPGSDQGWVLPWSAPAMEKPLGFTDKVSSIERGNLLAPHYLPMKQWVAVHGEAVPCTYRKVKGNSIFCFQLPAGCRQR